MLKLDHIVISCADLNEGTRMVEDRLGVQMQPGGKHALMGTHNTLLGLGPDVYLEVIAIDPGAPDPGRPRWYDLDRFAGPPRLTHWAARCRDLKAQLDNAPAGAGEAHELSRGDYRWTMAIPADGILPFDDRYPALLQWHGDLHPAKTLTDSGLRLTSLVVEHPLARALQDSLADLGDEPRMAFQGADTPGIRACLAGPKGEVWL